MVQDRKIFVVSDTHFSHVNILKFEDADGIQFRGSVFDDVEDMNETMVRNWNNVVSPYDIIYHLGDVYFGSSEKADAILSRLAGRKRLILGNHDNGKDPVLLKHFEKVLVSRIFKEYDAILSHIPLHEGSLNPEKCSRNVHGHIHEKVIKDKRYINVSVEQTRYTPVELRKL